MAEKRIPVFSVGFEKDPDGDGGTLSMEPCGAIPASVVFVRIDDGTAIPAETDANGIVSARIPGWSRWVLASD